MFSKCLRNRAFNILPYIHLNIIINSTIRCISKADLSYFFQLLETKEAATVSTKTVAALNKAYLIILRKNDINFGNS